MEELDTLYLYIESYGSMHISSIYSEDEDIVLKEEESEILRKIIEIEADLLLRKEEFIKINHHSKIYHTHMIYNHMCEIYKSIIMGCFIQHTDFNIIKLKKYIHKELEVFLPSGHMTLDFPQRLKEVLSLEKEDTGELYQLDIIIETTYDKLLEPYLIRRNVINAYTYKKDGINYDYYLNLIKDNIRKALIHKAKTYNHLTQEQSLIFKESRKLMKYIRTVIIHTLPKAVNGIYNDKYEVHPYQVDIDTLKSHKEESNIEKQVAQYVIRQTLEEQIYLQNAINARIRMLSYLRTVLTLKNAPHHILMFLDITWVNRVPGVVNKELYDTKTPYNKITLERYYNDIFYSIKYKIERSINKHLLYYTDHQLNPDDYKYIDYNLSHQKPYGKDNMIGEYTLQELSPTVTNINKWKERIEKELEDHHE